MPTLLPKIPQGRPHGPSWSESWSSWAAPSLRALRVWGMPGHGHGTPHRSPGLQWEGVGEMSDIPCLPAAKFPMCYRRSPAKGNVTFP